jgi:hypothetical protein
MRISFRGIVHTLRKALVDEQTSRNINVLTKRIHASGASVHEPPVWHLCGARQHERYQNHCTALAGINRPLIAASISFASDATAAVPTSLSGASLKVIFRIIAN